MSYNFGTRSNNNLNTCHTDLITIMNLAIKLTPTDFGIHAGARTVKQQQQYFDDKASKINPSDHKYKINGRFDMSLLAKKAKHVVLNGDNLYSKSRAIDFHISEYMPGKNLTWDKTHMMVVIGVIMASAKYLYDEGLVAYKIRSGANWSGQVDGVFIYDQKFLDMPHIEMINYP